MKKRVLTRYRETGKSNAVRTVRSLGVKRPKGGSPDGGTSSRSPHYKWKFAMGTTSRVPNSKYHYLIADFDFQHLRVGIIAGMKPNHIFVQRTPNGWHVYTDLQMTFKRLINNLQIIGADKKWIEIGQSRGYLFLADKGPVTLPWSVERMEIHAPRKGR